MEFDESFWDERYRQHSEHGSVWSGQPNAQLVVEVAGLMPGSALDVGAGEGADAVWLARRGWRVTAVDISSVALARAAAAVAPDPETAARISWQHQDLTVSPPPAGTFDLVSAQYLHLPAPERDGVYHRLAASVAPGGTLLIVGHHPSDLETSVRRPSAPGLLFTAEQAAADLDPDEWEIITCAARPRATTDSDDVQVTVRDAVLNARRRA
ncbi:bifunctional 2-polyprenyl-6-hydroxyphenol methylase/3-demethylubiquinol 3-O-methyltransferase UbiG [Arthrobacter sp. B3I4]|uniref:class I SAM-dependent methyltransferase n=1 Tax=Arthrobacter sp. B3I4 TaxID=3042267 RepID=UPI00277E29DB|nr:class I SAM-dependent methyltransferase [Arthrobacter sp. B3I4]MDQ0754424.1 SAM-dependent methyltransferase [Arthrobacter sp. B3I4]